MCGSGTGVVQEVYMCGSGAGTPPWITHFGGHQWVAPNLKCLKSYIKKDTCTVVIFKGKMFSRRYIDTTPPTPPWRNLWKPQYWGLVLKVQYSLLGRYEALLLFSQRCSTPSVHMLTCIYIETEQGQRHSKDRDRVTEQGQRQRDRAKTETEWQSKDRDRETEQR